MALKDSLVRLVLQFDIGVARDGNVCFSFGTLPLTYDSLSTLGTGI